MWCDVVCITIVVVLLALKLKYRQFTTSSVHWQKQPSSWWRTNNTNEWEFSYVSLQGTANVSRYYVYWSRYYTAVKNGSCCLYADRQILHIQFNCIKQHKNKFRIMMLAAFVSLHFRRPQGDSITHSTIHAFCLLF